MRHEPANQQAPGYSALIRTSSSASTLSTTIESLQAQSIAPQSWVFVDQNSQDGTLDLLPVGAEVVAYELPQYNHSHALNQGARHIDSTYTLIISSHTSLANREAMKYALGLMERDPTFGAAYFSHEGDRDLDVTRIDHASFDGFNGLWNSCSIVRTSLIRERLFRTEVFAAEDQEWAAWLIGTRGLSVGRISGGGRQYQRPGGETVDKRANDYLAVAMFVRHDLLSIRNCATLFARGIKHLLLGHVVEARFFATTLARIVRAKVRQLVRHWFASGGEEIRGDETTSGRRRA